MYTFIFSSHTTKSKKALDHMIRLKSVFSKIITCLIKIELLVLHFFTLNTFGYALYCYLVCVFVFGRQIENPNIYEQGFVFIAGLIILEVVTFALFFYLVLRFPSGRDLIYTYVSPDFVISCIGNPGSKTLVRALGVLTSLTALGLFEQAGQSYVNRYQTQNYIDMCRESGQATKDQIVEDMMLNRTDTGSKLGRMVVDPGSTVVKAIIEGILPPYKP
jgi:hypothetical protein